MNILGLSCFYHDSAACMLRDGRIIAACQEERFSRIKHDRRFPEESVRHCLDAAGITIDEVDLVSFYEKPFLKFERVLETFLTVSPRGLPAFLDTIPSWIKQKLRMRHVISTRTGYEGKVLFPEHHQAHAASSYFASPFDEAALLTVDGVGEWATASYGHALGTKLTLARELRFPHSLGLLYSAVTSFLGFTVNNDEYKVMGMAPYGNPVYTDAILSKPVSLKPDGSLALELDYFAFQYGRRMFNRRKFARLFGTPPRKPGAELRQEHYDIAASLQKVTEKVILKMALHVHRETGSRNLCLAGGVALNSVSNGRLFREGPFDRIFIQPAAGDAGAAMGAAYLAYHAYAGGTDRSALGNVYLGPSYESAEIKAALEDAGLGYSEYAAGETVNEAARLLLLGKVVGWFQGRMEFGPRALGNRSILADPRRPEMKEYINSKVKFREAFRPFAPAAAEEDASRYFAVKGSSPFMLFTCPVLTRELPAITHVDGSARVQTVSAHDNPRFHALLKAFEKSAGMPVLLNTSLNIKGEPIAMSPADAVRCFRESGLDALVMENCVVVK